MPGFEYTKGELTNTKRDKEIFQGSADNDYAPDSIVDFLQMDYILPEDEIEYTSQKTYTPNESTENKQVEMTSGQMHTKKFIHIKIKNKKREVDGISCDPYNIEENIDLIEAQNEFQISVDKQEKMVTSDAVDYVSQISSTSSSKVLDKTLKKKKKPKHKKTHKNKKTLENKKTLKNKKTLENKKTLKIKKTLKNKTLENKNSWINNGEKKITKEFSKISVRTQLLSSEKADELLKSVMYFVKSTEDHANEYHPNVCLLCKFESNSVEERIEHLKTEKHKTAFYSSIQTGIQNANDLHICPLCGFYSEISEERIEHLKYSRHTGAQEIKKAIICGILENYTTNTFYCTVCSLFVTDIEPLIEHILSSRHHNSELRSPYLYKKYNLIKTDFRGHVICIVCNCILNYENDSDELYDHLMNHQNKCYHFNFNEKGCPHSHKYICDWPHKCGMCGGKHPQIKCYLYKGGNSNLDPVHGNVNIPSRNSDTHLEHNAIVARETEYSNKKMCRENSHDSALAFYEQFVFLKNCKNRISYSPENDKNKYESHQRGDKSRSPTRRYGSRNLSHRKYDSSIAYSRSPIGRDPIKEHATKSPLKQPLFTDTKQTSISNSSIGFGDINPIKEHAAKSPLEQPLFTDTKQTSISNSSISFGDINPIKKHAVKSPLEQLLFTDIKQKSISNSSISFSDINPIKEQATKSPLEQPLFTDTKQTSISNSSISFSDINPIKKHAAKSPLEQLLFTDIKQTSISNSSISFSDINPIKEQATKSPLEQPLFTDIKQTSISNSSFGFSDIDPIKEHAIKSPLEQLLFTDIKQTSISNSSISVSDIDSDDEDEEFNIITTIVKLLKICNLLGNLGYFFEDTLNKALEMKDSTDDVLDILREPANIILMEVILKKLKTFEKSVYDSRVCKKFIKGIMYITYLIDASKSSLSCNFSQDFSYMLNSSPLPSVRSSTNSDIVSNLSSASAELIASSWPSVTSKNLKLCHGLNVEKIAKLTIGKNIEYTVNFIKNSLKNIERTQTQNVVCDIALAVSNVHFKMISDT